MGAEKAVVVRGGDNAVREEIKAGGIITPGQLLEINSAGAAIRHNSAGASQYGLFADIDRSLGSRDIDVNYASGEQVQCIWARRGMEINTLLKEGETITIGEFVESDGAGDVQAHLPDASNVPVFTSNIVGIGREALDLSDSSGADPSSRRLLVSIV